MSQAPRFSHDPHRPGDNRKGARWCLCGFLSQLSSVCFARERPRETPRGGRQDTYLGTLGGALVGREGTCGGAPPNHSPPPPPPGKGGSGPGLKGTGGAPEWGPGEGTAGAGPRPDAGRARGAPGVGRLWVVGLGGGDLRTEQSSVGRTRPQTDVA